MSEIKDTLQGKVAFISGGAGAIGANPANAEQLVSSFFPVPAEDEWVVVRAIAPNGRFMDGLGLCDYRERCCPKADNENAVCKNKARWHEHCTAGAIASHSRCTPRAGRAARFCFLFADRFGPGLTQRRRLASNALLGGFFDAEAGSDSDGRDFIGCL